MDFKSIEELSNLSEDSLQQYLKSMSIEEGLQYSKLLESQKLDESYSEKEAILFMKVRNEPILKKFNKALKKLPGELDEYVKQGLLSE